MSAFIQGLQFGFLQSSLNSLMGVFGCYKPAVFSSNPFCCFQPTPPPLFSFPNYSFNAFSIPFMPYTAPPTFMPYQGIIPPSLPVIDFVVPKFEPIFDFTNNQSSIDHFVKSTPNIPSVPSLETEIVATPLIVNQKLKTNQKITYNKEVKKEEKEKEKQVVNKPKKERKTKVVNGKYDQFIEKYSAQFKVDPNLVRAVISTESSNNSNAVSKKGAKGLMQLMPETAKEMGVVNVLDPEQNIMGGVKYLSKMLKRHNGNIKLALASYNAGPGAVDKHNGVPPYKETQKYVKKVMQRYNNLKNS